MLLTRLGLDEPLDARTLPMNHWNRGQSVQGVGTTGFVLVAGIMIDCFSEAVLYIIAFALAGAVLSMFVQQTVGGTIEESLVLLTSVGLAAIGALTAWFMHSPLRR